MSETNVLSSEIGTKAVTSLSSSAAPELNVFANVGSSFLLVICLILLIVWLIKRSGFKKHTSSLITIKSHYPITAKERIILVEVDNQLLVVGVTTQQMTLLHTINEEHTKEILSQEQANKSTPMNSVFQQLLQSALKRKS